MSTFIRNRPPRKPIARVLIPPPFEQPQTGGEPLTANSVIAGLPNDANTPQEIVNAINDALNQLTQIDQNKNGRADTSDDNQNAPDYVSLFTTGLLQ